MLKRSAASVRYRGEEDQPRSRAILAGYKLHLDVADGQIPISAILTSASVHDSQVAIPLMTMTWQRVTHLYELMDSAYDADLIHEHSKQLQHVPIIAPHPRRGTKQPSQLPKIFPEKPAPEMTSGATGTVQRADDERTRQRAAEGRVRRQ